MKILNLILNNPPELFLPYQRDNPQQNNCADNRRNQLPEKASASDSQPAEQRAADKTADNSNDKVPKKAAARTFKDKATQVSGEQSY
jgi:hypothetical protein